MADTSDDLPGTYVEGFHDLAAVRKMTYREMPHYGKVSIMSFGASGLGGMHTAGKGSGLKDATGNAVDTTDAWFAEDPEEDKVRARDIVLKALECVAL